MLILETFWLRVLRSSIQARTFGKVKVCEGSARDLGLQDLALARFFSEGGATSGMHNGTADEEGLDFSRFNRAK